MRYTVEFELHSDLGTSIGDAVHKALQSAFGSIDELRIMPIRAYIGDIQQDQRNVRRELRGEA